jgi:Virus neck protein
MPLNSLFPNDGTSSERNISENLIIESIRMFGREFYYIPRELVAKDNILGEDNLSKFKNAFMIEGYLDNIDNFGGNGAYLSKFGLTIEEQAQVTIARKRWEELVGQHSATILPNRRRRFDVLSVK